VTKNTHIMGAKKYLVLLLCVTAQGFPQGDEYYNDQDYQYDYDEDEKLPLNDVDDSNTIPLFHVPTIISDSVMLDVDNGMTIRLPCIVDKLPSNVQIIWSKEDSQKTQIAIGTLVVAPEYVNRATVNVDNTGSTLHIGIAKSEDAGKYKCSVAVQGDQPTLKHEVRIRAPPSVDISTPSLLEVSKGDDVTLNCRANGKPTPSVRWTRVGKMMPDGRPSIESETVTFGDVSRHHAGTYKCIASNGHGREASKEVEVVVKYAPEIEVNEMFVHGKAGQDKVEMICNVHAHPRPNVIWEKHGETVATNVGRVKYTNIGSRHTLVIEHVKKEDFGKYSCKATNNLGSQQRVIELSGHASYANFVSSAEGSSENEFLLEWTSKSFTPITNFEVEVAVEGSNNWKRYSVDAYGEGNPYLEVGAYHWAGKHFLSDLTGSTQYKARVRATNGEGTSQWGPAWNFATLGAKPLEVRGSASLVSSGAIIIFSCVLLLLRM